MTGERGANDAGGAGELDGVVNRAVGSLAHVLGGRGGGAW